MNVHALPVTTFGVWVGVGYEPDQGDEAGYHEFHSQAEAKAFKDGLDYAGEELAYWEANGPDEGTYFYCTFCGDWLRHDDIDAFYDEHDH